MHLVLAAPAKNINIATVKLSKILSKQRQEYPALLLRNLYRWETI
jgi:hypothetical protein